MIQVRWRRSSSPWWLASSFSSSSEGSRPSPYSGAFQAATRRRVFYNLCEGYDIYISSNKALYILFATTASQIGNISYYLFSGNDNFRVAFLRELCHMYISLKYIKSTVLFKMFSYLTFRLYVKAAFSLNYKVIFWILVKWNLPSLREKCVVNRKKVVNILFATGEVTENISDTHL